MVWKVTTFIFLNLTFKKEVFIPFNIEFFKKNIIVYNIVIRKFFWEKAFFSNKFGYKAITDWTTYISSLYYLNKWLSYLNEFD